MGLVSSSVAHLDRHYHPGTIVVSEGPVNASSDNFAVEIIGQGAHGARPHESIDAVVVGSLMIMALQTIVSREVDPARPSVVSVGQFHAGTAPNVIAGQAKLEGTVRAQDPAIRQQLLNSVRRIAESISQLHGAKISVTVTEGTPPLTPDFIVDEDSASYPSGGDYRLEQMQAEGYPALLRIERGRVKNREIFGPMRLDYGFFKRQARRTNYFLARSGTQVVGAVGYTMDQVEHTVRVFELIALADDVVRFLLVELERTCREEMGSEYIEIDVSAYAPRMQRTLLELNFLSVAYVPAMVFYQVERLDIVKMVRLNKRQDLGPLGLTGPVQAVADVVMRGFSTCVIAPRMARAIKEVPLFHGMNTEQATRLAEVCTVKSMRRGKRLFAEHDPTDRLYVVLQGRVIISGGPSPAIMGTIHTGETCGEVSLLSARPHSATAMAVKEIEVAELPRKDLEDLIRRRPDIGVIIYRNLAIGLGDKLLRSGEWKRDQERSAAGRLLH